MPKILAVAGSFREHSYSKRVLHIAADGARAAGADVTVIDLRDFPMSIYNNDDYEVKFDDQARRLQDLMHEQDGFLLASPEYNGSMPGGFKNAIDWTSRPSDRYGMYEPVKGKTAAIMSASPGQFGGLRCLAHLRGVLTIMGVTVLPSEIAVGSVAQKFDGDALVMTDEKMRSGLEGLGVALVTALE